MIQLSARDLILIHEHLPSLYQLQSLDDFAVTVMQVIPKIVESEVTGYTEINPPLKRVTGAMSSPTSEAIYLEHKPQFEECMQSHPLVQHFLQSEDMSAKKVSDFLSLKQWCATDIYQKFYRHFDLTRQMVMSLPVEKPALLGIALNRARKDFTERDRTLINYLLPHVTQAYQNAVAYTEATQKISLMGQVLDSLNVGIVELNRIGRIDRLSALATDTFAAFFPEQFVNGSRMPPTIDDWVLEQMQRLTSEHGYEEPTSPYVIKQEHGRLTLRLMKAQQSDGYIMTTERYIASASSDTLRMVLNLTKRESEILYWVAQGKANAEIGIVLNISPRTVQKHLEAIFEKLGVDTRVQAAIKATHVLMNHQ